MTDAADLLRLPASNLRRLMDTDELTPSALVAACLEAIEARNGELNAIVTLSETVMDEARALERSATEGASPGPLYGLPVGIKDVTEVAGMRTTYGSPLYADNVATEDALIVKRLRDAGAIILGKTNTPEFAAGGNTFNEVFGRTRNPWDPALSAGGSTGGGGAALAAGMIAIAEGTDLGGSLRIPASFCGVVGLRPSPGLIPTWPTAYLWDDLQVTGTMGRTAEDIAIVLDAVAGASPLSPAVQSVSGREFAASVRRGPPKNLRVAYVPDPVGLGIDPEVARVCRQGAMALDGAGLIVEEIGVDLSYGFEAFLALRGYWMAAHHHRHLDVLDRLGANVRGNVERGLQTTVRELAAAERVRGRMWGEFRDLFDTYDHVLTPCTAVPPFPVELNYPESIAGRKMETYVDWIAPTFVLSLTGLPVACVPAGLDVNGLPVGLQVVGRPRSEEAVLALAGRVQELRPIGLP